MYFRTIAGFLFLSEPIHILNSILVHVHSAVYINIIQHTPCHGVNCKYVFVCIWLVWYVTNICSTNKITNKTFKKLLRITRDSTWLQRCSENKKSWNDFPTRPGFHGGGHFQPLEKTGKFCVCVSLFEFSN